MSRTKKAFDAWYAGKTCVWGSKPHGNVEAILNFKTAGTVLDLGCGEGRDSLFLAERGFRVTCVDESENGVKKLRQLAGAAGLTVESIVADITQFQFRQKYDIIILNDVLNLMSAVDAYALIAAVKENTTPCGLNAIEAFTEETIGGDNFQHFFKKGELRTTYAGWEITYFNKFFSKFLRRAGKPAAESVVARKPVSNL